MVLVTGQIAGITGTGSSRIARIRVGGAHTHVSLELVGDANVGDVILAEGGVAIGRLETGTRKEQSHVPGNSR